MVINFYYSHKVFSLAVFILLSSAVISAQDYKIGDISDGSRAIPLHKIKLFDHDSLIILEGDDPQLPLSTKNTCGDCHSYDKISEGFHFNASDSGSADGRRGEPWIYLDWQRLTLLPVSFRNWRGAFNPIDVGIAPMRFLDLFGTHYTGGGFAEKEEIQSPENFFRWEISGKLEVNCLLCHDASEKFDPNEHALQISRQNYKWAASASSEIAAVKGNAKKMPDNFDLYNPNTFVDLDLRSTSPPGVSFGKAIFDEKNRVFFNISKSAGNLRCYYCHSSIQAENEPGSHWNRSEDVHMAGGMDCIDCHKNGVDHKIIRGYNKEGTGKQDIINSYTCEGCHLGNEDIYSYGNNHGAPRPAHKGLPPIHFEKLECTLCHSGKLPGSKTEYLKTSRAHKLGLPRSSKQGDAFPHIQSPVYFKNEHDKLEPRNLITPSFWAVRDSSSIKPIVGGAVYDSLSSLITLDTLLNYGKWHSVSDSAIIGALKFLSKKSSSDSVYLFVSGGKTYELNEEGGLKIGESGISENYSWAIGHDVRPASQSLGSGGCGDCHSFSSNFFFGDVVMESSLKSESDTLIAMTEFSGYNTLYQKAFSFSFFFRPWLKALLIISFSIILLVFLIHTARAIIFLMNKSSDNL